MYTLPLAGRVHPGPEQPQVPVGAQGLLLRALHRQARPRQRALASHTQPRAHDLDQLGALQQPAGGHRAHTQGLTCCSCNHWLIL